MPQSLLRLIRRCAEYLPQEQSPQVPGGLRGVYVLYRQTRKRRSKKDQYDVVYVGLGRTGQRGGIRSRLRSHRRTKKGLWTHFSIFEVWGNIRDEEIRELEGLFRHIYKRDSQASPLNVARGFKPLRKVRNNKIEAWGES